MGRAQKIKNRIKNSSFFGGAYLITVGAFVKILQLFIRPNEKQILFISYSGRQYSDTPKEAYNMLRNDPAFKDYELVWAMNKPKMLDHCAAYYRPLSVYQSIDVHYKR